MSGPSTSTSGSTASSTLWAHLLNKDATASGSGLNSGLASLGLAASAPADKTGTSVRILLHDTQATIEKFSDRVDRLLSEAEGSRQKLLARNEEVNDEVERLVRQVIQEQGTLLLHGFRKSRWGSSHRLILGFRAEYFQNCAHILTLNFCHHQWVEQKQRSGRASGNQPELPLSPNCGSLLLVPWML
jgi:hypothetical protein